MNLGDIAKRSKLYSPTDQEPSTQETTSYMLKMYCSTEDQFDFLNIEKSNDSLGGASFRCVSGGGWRVCGLPRRDAHPVHQLSFHTRTPK